MARGEGTGIGGCNRNFSSASGGAAATGRRRVRVLFYLPVVTGWWFEQVIEPLIRRVAQAAEVHVLAPVRWRNTGLGPAELARCADLGGVHWAIIDGDDHRSLRTVPIDPAALIDHVAALAPDLVLCRSADFDTPAEFPGTVRYLMEAVTTPFDLVSPANTVQFTATPFRNGAMPALAAADAARIDALIAPYWDDMQAHWRAAIPDRDTLFGAFGMPLDRPAVLLPIEYAHAENFFLRHRLNGLSDQGLVARAAAAATAAGVTLVVTNHPLNALHVDRDALFAFVGTLDGPILADHPVRGVAPTTALLGHVDGVLLGDSKTFATAAAFGTPSHRHSRFASAPWLRAETDLPGFFRAVREGRAVPPDAGAVRRWFGYHFANEAFCPTDPALTGAMVLDRALKPVDSGRWEDGIARLRRFAPVLEAAA